MKLFSNKNILILKSFCLTMLLLAWVMFEINDPFEKFMLITATVVTGIMLAMDLYDYRNTNS